MSQHAPARWLVTYDISDRRKLARVHRLLKKEGVPIQYSVFFVHASAAKMARLMVELGKLIDPKADDVRAYRLPEATWKVTLGASVIPDDVWIEARPRP